MVSFVEEEQDGGGEEGKGRGLLTITQVGSAETGTGTGTGGTHDNECRWCGGRKGFLTITRAGGGGGRDRVYLTRFACLTNPLRVHHVTERRRAGKADHCFPQEDGYRGRSNYCSTTVLRSYSEYNSMIVRAVDGAVECTSTLYLPHNCRYTRTTPTHRALYRQYQYQSKNFPAIKSKTSVHHHNQRETKPGGFTYTRYSATP